MSLTSYRAAPPRVNIYPLPKRQPHPFWRTSNRASISEAGWRDPRGRDVLMDDVFDGGYVSPTTSGAGAYVNSAGKLEINPVDVANPCVPSRRRRTIGNARNGTYRSGDPRVRSFVIFH